MKKEKVTGVVLLFFLVCFVYAENKITRFDGGKHNIDLSMYSSFFSGVSARNQNFGSTVSSSILDPALTVKNPAGLGFFKESQVSWDAAPGFSLNFGSMIKKNVNQSVDDAIKDNQAPDIDKTYPKLDLFAGQSGWLNGLSLVSYNKEYGSFGLTWYRPFYLNMNMTGNDISFVVEDSVLKNIGQADQYVEKTVLPLSMELFANMEIGYQTAQLSWGKQIGDQYSIGCGINFNRFQMIGGLDGKIGGFIRQYGGDTDINVSFDDPNVSYRNTMNDTLSVDFSNNLTGGNLGFSWHPNETYALDLVCNLPKKAKLNGSLDIVQHTLGALNMGYEENGLDGIPGNADDEEMFDVELLKPSQLAFTNRTVYHSSDLTLRLPGDVAFAASYTNGSQVLIFSYEYPLSELSLDYSCYRYRDGQFKDSTDVFQAYADTTKLSYKIGLKPKHNVKIAWGWRRYAVSCQLFVCDQISQGTKDSDGNPTKPIKNLIIPSLSFGSRYHLTKNILTDITIIALPNPILKTTLTWMF